MTPLQKRIFWVALVCIGLCIGSGWLAKGTPQEMGYWYSIVPPLLAIGLALITHNVIYSLAIAVVAGGFLAAVPKAVFSFSSWWGGITTSVGYVHSSATDTFNLQILIFIVLVMAAIAVMIVAGGLQGIVNWLMRFAKGVRSTQFVTALMGLFLFIDDYANTMIIGNSLRPLTDKNKISREKLAFIVDATSAPVAGLAIISTWIGYEVGLFGKTAETLGIAKDGYAMFFDALPFRFYCILMIAFVFINALFGKDYGPMAKAQKRSLETGALSEPDAKSLTSKAYANATPSSNARVRALSAIIPVASLFIFLLGGIWWDGGGMAKLSESSFALFSVTAWREVISTSENSILLLAYAAGLALILSSLCAKFISHINFKEIFTAAFQGLKSSILPVTILILAWSLKGACDGLLTGKFLAHTVGGIVSPILFPLILFIVAGMTAFATGTSWGTMAILIPTAIPIAFQLDGASYGLVTIISLGAVLDGAIFGDHCSPISDTTIMSSISSSCDHIHHVRTQIPYALTVAGLALGLGYLPAAFGVPSWVGILLSIGAIIGLFTLVKRHHQEKTSVKPKKKAQIPLGRRVLKPLEN